MKIVRTKEVEWTPGLQKGAYFQRRKELGGGEKLSCSLWELAPGKKSFPLHGHMVTDEAVYVISGTAKVRTPEGLFPIGPGDYVPMPAGGPAHQLINDGKEPLVYIGMSATQGMDIVEYPDSNKIGVAAGKPPHGKRYVFKKGDVADYFADDKDAEG